MNRVDEKLSIIGRRQPKLDGPQKTTGRSQFTDDIRLPGMLHGKILRSPVAHARILSEECLLEQGRLLNPSLLDYRLPRTFEAPEVDRSIVESIDPYGPFGAKEVGEGPLMCTMAIANAVSHAIGKPLYEFPLTPQRVLRAIRSKT